MAKEICNYSESEFKVLRKEMPGAIILGFEKEIKALVSKVKFDSEVSGMTMPFFAHAVSKAVEQLCRNMPLSPINDIDDQWYLPDVGFEAFAIANVEESDVRALQEDLDNYKPELQHKRLSSLFKDHKGVCRYLDAIVWVDGEDQFTGTVEGISSSQGVRFPFTPKTFYIDVEESDDGEYQIKNYNDLEAVFNYYNQV